MDMVLTRTSRRPDGIFSDFISNDGSFKEFTLEHAYADGNGGWMPKIPNGTYTCTRYLSPHFGYVVFQIMNVPNCQNIEIHRGNFNKDSEGCVLLGDADSFQGATEIITGSADAFNRFMTLQDGVDSFNLEVTG